MDDDLRWMYDDWNKSGAHSNESMVKTKKFIVRAFFLSSTSCNASVRTIYVMTKEECQ